MDRTYGALAQTGAPGAGVEKLLGDLEREIMEHLWQRGEVSVRDVLGLLNQQRPADRHLAYTTAMTVMARLADKGLLRRRLVGKAHHYAAALTRDAFLARSSERLARQLVRDFGDAAIASFVEVLQGVAPERLARLRQIGQPHGPTASRD